MRTIFISICLLLCCATLTAQVSVQGKAPAYAGNEIVFHRYEDLITYTEVEVARCKVAPDGSFKLTILLASPTFLFTHLDIYFVYFYANKSGAYTLYLPEKQAKTQEDKINPFFSETPIHAGLDTEAPQDVNHMMTVFDGYYNDYYAALIGQMKKNDPAPFNQDILLLDTLFRTDNNGEFEKYKRYRLGLFKQQSGWQKSKGLSLEYFVNQPILYGNTAYMELFHQVYNRYFDFLSRTKEGRDIFEIVNRKNSLSKLKKIMLRDSVFHDDTLLELVILKNLYDNFYDDKFSRSALLVILDSLQENTRDPHLKIIASNIRKKVTQLMVGYVPPAIELYDVQGQLRTLAEFKGKTVYLNFCSVSSYGCLKEFVELDRLYKKYHEKIEIITVCVDDDIEAIRNFLSYEHYSWIFLHYAHQPEILENYDVRVYPTYYLIGEDGMITHSLAPSPAENVESIFSKL